MPQPKLKDTVKKDWINIRRVDTNWSLRDYFIMENVWAGADSVGKLMAVTYLTQFQYVTGEFSRRPVYAPNFHIGYIPYSSSLLKDLEEVASRGRVTIAGIEGKLSTPAPSLNHDASREFFLATGAQLARLYRGNISNLKGFGTDDSRLYEVVRALWFRDRDSRRAYTQRAVPL